MKNTFETMINTIQDIDHGVIKLTREQIREVLRCHAKCLASCWLFKEFAYLDVWQRHIAKHLPKGHSFRTGGGR